MQEQFLLQLLDHLDHQHVALAGARTKPDVDGRIHAGVPVARVEGHPFAAQPYRPRPVLVLDGQPEQTPEHPTKPLRKGAHHQLRLADAGLLDKRRRLRRHVLQRVRRHAARGVGNAGAVGRLLLQFQEKCEAAFRSKLRISRSG